MWRPHDRTVFDEAKGFGSTNSSPCATTALATVMQKAIYCRRLTGSVVIENTGVIGCPQMVRIGKCCGGGRSGGILATQENQNAPSSLSRSPTPCRFNHPHLASRVNESERWVSEGRRLMARVHAHPRSKGPKMDSLYTILGCLLRSSFVSPLWI
jgi:hypothetical protein